MNRTIKKCFVCKQECNNENSQLNQAVGLPVCGNCKGTTKEKEAEDDHLDSLADGLVCGCI